ncbi:hypothetical protein BGZ60DRAFT_532108 [Tricladium varicosporioides]|nr:hypothetical protein BGZ60DRAFT_532108 [Hymenoscyphus varicosporioides]
MNQRFIDTRRSLQSTHPTTPNHSSRPSLSFHGNSPNTITTTSCNVNSSGATTFHQFPLLPYELRSQIWHHFVLTPRTIELQRLPPKTTNPAELSRYIAASEPPAALSVCQESREIALGRYTLCDNYYRLFVNPEVDTLYFGSLIGSQSFNYIHAFILQARLCGLGKIKKLAVLHRNMRRLGIEYSHHCQPVSFNQAGFARSGLGIFTDLEELVVIFNSPCPCESSSTIKSGDECEQCEACKLSRLDITNYNGWRYPTITEMIEKAPLDERKWISKKFGSWDLSTVTSVHDCKNTGAVHWLWRDIHSVRTVRNAEEFEDLDESRRFYPNLRAAHARIMGARPSGGPSTISN